MTDEDFTFLPLPSNKKFGWLFVAIFLAISLFMFHKNFNLLALALIFTSSILSFVTLFYSPLLLPLNKLWYRFGLLLGSIVSPVVLGLIFFALITPTSYVTRLFARDILFLKKRLVSSYWIDRDHEDFNTDFFKKQF